MPKCRRWKMSSLSVCMHLIRLIGVIYLLILAFAWIKLVDECCSHHLICIMNHDNCWQIWWLTTLNSAIFFLLQFDEYFEFGDSDLCSCNKISLKNKRMEKGAAPWRMIFIFIPKYNKNKINHEIITLKCV